MLEPTGTFQLSLTNISWPPISITWGVGGVESPGLNDSVVKDESV